MFDPAALLLATSASIGFTPSVRTEKLRKIIGRDNVTTVDVLETFSSATFSPALEAGVGSEGTFELLRFLMANSTQATSPRVDFSLGEPIEFNLPVLFHTVVKRTFALARIDLSSVELRHAERQLEAVLDYVSQLSQVDVEGVEPLTHPEPIANVFRPDASRPSLTAEEATRNAPEKAGPFFVVPKVVE